MSDLPLPPLPAVRAFDAAARTGSFSRAAEELGMTQSAVSYQIKLLEDRVETPLFLRRARGVELTEEGARFAATVAEALTLLRDGYAQVQRNADETLTISVLASFAAYVLAPRIGRFQVANPQVKLRIDVSHELADLLGGEATVAIRTGSGDWPGLAADLLMRSPLTPMLSPSLLARHGPLTGPADLLRFPLIDAADPAWLDWFRAAGIRHDDLPVEQLPGFGSQVLEAHAALAGQGVCLLTPAYFGDHLQRGELIRPFDIVTGDAIDIWLVYPKRRRSSPAIRAFRQWILQELQMPGQGGAGLDALSDSA